MAPFIKDQKPEEVQKINYDVDYFISKFSNIPDDQWCEGDFIDRAGRKCALGHCGVTFKSEFTQEAHTLFEVLGHIAASVVNDNYAGKFSQYGDTPKERIVNYLKAVKRGEVN